jgi:hypothetical protein
LGAVQQAQDDDHIASYRIGDNLEASDNNQFLGVQNPPHPSDQGIIG